MLNASSLLVHLGGFQLVRSQLGLANKPIFLVHCYLVRTFRTDVSLPTGAVASLIFTTLCEVCLVAGHGQCIISFPFLGVILALLFLMVSLVWCPVIMSMIAQYICSTCNVLGVFIVLHWELQYKSIQPWLLLRMSRYAIIHFSNAPYFILSCFRASTSFCYLWVFSMSLSSTYVPTWDFLMSRDCLNLFI